VTTNSDLKNSNYIYNNCALSYNLFSLTSSIVVQNLSYTGIILWRLALAVIRITNKARALSAVKMKSKGWVCAVKVMK